MKYHVLFVIFEKAAKFKLSSAANCRWCFNILHLFQSFPPVTEAMEFASMSNTDIFSSQKGEFECFYVKYSHLILKCFYVKYRHL